MPEYLTQFSKKLKPHEGSLVRVKSVIGTEPNAKEYLNKLSKEGSTIKKLMTKDCVGRIGEETAHTTFANNRICGVEWFLGNV